MKRGKSKPGNVGKYEQKLEALVAEKKGPGLFFVDVVHDPSCSFFRNLVCNCDPELTDITNKAPSA